MTNIADPSKWIKTAEPGTMVYARQAIAPGAPMTTGLLIREEPARVAAFGRDPLVAMRCGAFEQDGVLLVVVLVKIGRELYETWFNYHQTGGGEQFFRDLMVQATINISFFTPDEAKMVAIRNRTGDFFGQALIHVTQLPAWSMHDFDAARAKVYARYPTVAKLWREVK
jgi:hypothetical protein